MIQKPRQKENRHQNIPYTTIIIFTYDQTKKTQTPQPPVTLINHVHHIQCILALLMKYPLRDQY